MSRRRITLDVKASTVIIRGWKGGDIAREAGCRPIFSGAAGGGWIVDRERLTDLLALLDHRNIAAVVAGGDQAPPDRGGIVQRVGQCDVLDGAAMDETEGLLW